MELIQADRDEELKLQAAFHGVEFKDPMRSQHDRMMERLRR